ncbi:hypothetical protein KUCAC02_020294, partial [Chaenocephalus aceratus]
GTATENEGGRKGERNIFLSGLRDWMREIGRSGTSCAHKFALIALATLALKCLTHGKHHSSSKKGFKGERTREALVNRIPWKTLRNGGSLICVLSACQGLSHLKAFSQNVVETSLPIAADVLALVSALSRFVLDQRLAADPQVSWNLTSAK